MILNNNLNPVIDNVKNLPYNAVKKELFKVKREKVGIGKKREVVAEISRLFEEGEMSIPDACKKFNMQAYQYYNWKKRVDQLDAKKRKARSIASPVIIRKLAITQKPREQTDENIEPEVPTIDPKESIFREIVKEQVRELLKGML